MQTEYKCIACGGLIQTRDRCWNPFCKLGGIAQVPLLRETKDAECYNTQCTNNRTHAMKTDRHVRHALKLGQESRTVPMHAGETLQIKNVRRSANSPRYLLLTLNREPTNREIELIHWLGNLLLTAYDRAKEVDESDEA